MVSGPLMLRTDASPIRMRPSILTVNTDSSKVFCAPCTSASTGP
jgi:hypothetical protein